MSHWACLVAILRQLSGMENGLVQIIHAAYERPAAVPVEGALDLGLRVTAYAPDRSAVL